MFWGINLIFPVRGLGQEAEFEDETGFGGAADVSSEGNLEAGDVKHGSKDEADVRLAHA